MFWARGAALRPLVDAKLSFDDFPPERGQVRRTIQHAIERLVFLAAEHAGYRWAKIAAPACYPVTDPMMRITSSATLEAFVAGAHRRLLP